MGLVLAAGVLWFGEAVLLWTLGSSADVVGAFGLAAVQFGLTAVASGLAFATFRFAVIWFGLSIGTHLTDEGHTGFSIAAVVLSPVGFLLGGGIVLGSMLRILGGALAIGFGLDAGGEPRSEFDPSYLPRSAGLDRPGSPPPGFEPVVWVAQCGSCRSDLSANAVAGPDRKTPFLHGSA